MWLPGDKDDTSHLTGGSTSDQACSKSAPSGSDKVTSDSEMTEDAECAASQTPVTDLQSHLVGLFPDCDDLNTRGDAGFQPHLSLGQFKKFEVKRYMEEFQKSWNDIEFVVSEIYLISRKDFDDPFHVRKTVPLSKK